MYMEHVMAYEMWIRIIQLIRTKVMKALLLRITFYDKSSNNVGSRGLKDSSIKYEDI